jgi:hypothetical protein
LLVYKGIIFKQGCRRQRWSFDSELWPQSLSFPIGAVAADTTATMHLLVPTRHTATPYGVE